MRATETRKQINRDWGHMECICRGDACMSSTIREHKTDVIS